MITTHNIEVILVEDNPNDLDLTLHALKKARFLDKVHVVRDGAQALDFIFARGIYRGRVQATLPSVMLLDLKLPKVSGLEVLAEIKKDPRAKMLPVVVLTSSGEDQDIDKAYALGANSYIVKPVEFGKFYEALTTIGLYWIAVNQPSRRSGITEGN